MNPLDPLQCACGWTGIVDDAWTASGPFCPTCGKTERLSVVEAEVAPAPSGPMERVLALPLGYEVTFGKEVDEDGTHFLVASICDARDEEAEPKVLSGLSAESTEDMLRLIDGWPMLQELTDAT